MVNSNGNSDWDECIKVYVFIDEHIPGDKLHHRNLILIGFCFALLMLARQERLNDVRMNKYMISAHGS